MFALVVVATAGGAWLTTTDLVDSGVAVFVLVLAGWILSLILHEFAHAFVAWKGGDRSIPSKGYLTLDPRHYADPVTSIAIPLAVLVIGGIGLPGGAVWINRSALRSPLVASLVSLAGPATNFLGAAACFVPLQVGLIDRASTPILATGLTFLGFLQVFAFVLNLLPVPGLDGFGAIEPFLPRSVLAALAPVRAWGILVLVAVLFTVQPANEALFDAILRVVDAFGADRDLVRQGWELFRFWEG